jgi:hypothetical protein
MAYDLEAFIGPTEYLNKLFLGCEGIQVINVTCEFSVVPMSEELYRTIHDKEATSGMSYYEGIVGITRDTEEFGRLASRDGILAYVNISYHGGSGSQLAMVWKDESVLFGPIVDRRHAPPGRDGAVNRALALMGVAVGDAEDEFSALRLGSRRETDEWFY